MKERNINQQIGQSDFFSEYNKELKEIALSSKIQQEKLRRLRKIEQLREKQKQSIGCKEQKLLDNIVIDYLRSLNLNYSYSVFMRERNLISDEIRTKLNILKLLGLQNVYNSSEQFKISVLQLMTVQQAKQIQQTKQMKQTGIQVELIAKDKTVNNQLLNEIRIAEVRKEVEANQKKHYDKLLESLKHQLSKSMKEEMKIQGQIKMKNLRNEYQQQLKLLKDKNKQFLMNNPKINPKVQEYLSKVQQLQNKNCTLAEKVKELQKQRISHNCFKNEKIIEKDEALRRQKEQLQKKKMQYDLALRNLHTSIEELTYKKQKLQQEPKQTDVFVNDLKKNKASKDHMIEEIYGRLFLMNKRVQDLSKDNESLMEQNRQLLSKIKQLEALKEQLRDQYRESSKTQESMKKNITKPKLKDVFIGVTQVQIDQTFKGSKKEHAIDEDLSGLDSKQQDDQLDNKKKFKLQINHLYDQMKMIKNRLRFAVENFQ